MFNHVLHLSLQQFLYACGSARDKCVCVRRLSTETVEVRMYSLPIVHVPTWTYIIMAKYAGNLVPIKLQRVDGTDGWFPGWCCCCKIPQCLFPMMA